MITVNKNNKKCCETCNTCSNVYEINVTLTCYELSVLEDLLDGSNAHDFNIEIIRSLQSKLMRTE